MKRDAELKPDAPKHGSAVRHPLPEVAMCRNDQSAPQTYNRRLATDLPNGIARPLY